MNRRIIICLILILSAVYAYNCQNPFSPSWLGPGKVVPIARQTDPDSVLYNLKYSYEYRDSLVYENCLHKNFIFFYKDQAEDQLVEVEFQVPRDGRGGDIYRTNRLFAVFEDIQLGLWNVQYIDPAVDPLTGEEYEGRKVTFSLSLYDTNGDYNYQRLWATGYAEFRFKKSEDGWWRIIRWYDRSI